MTQDQAEYQTDTDEAREAMEMLGKGYDQQQAAIIESPRNVLALQDKGLVDYKVWGWVKLSAKFRPHIKILRGAKVSVWLCIALSIEEDGQFSATLKELQELTGYSHTEILASIKELEEMGYLSVNRGGKKNLYSPNFAARGENKPKESLLKKVESTPQYQVDSTPAIEKPPSSITELKESPFGDKQDLLDGVIQYQLKPKAIRDAFAKYFRLTPNWQAKYNRQFMEWAVEIQMTPEQIKIAADVWRMEKRFNWKAPDLRGVQEHWLSLIEEFQAEPAPVTLDEKGIVKSW
jgi:DNA-binding transcriptional ArsR family regulator